MSGKGLITVLDVITIRECLQEFKTTNLTTDSIIYYSLGGNVELQCKTIKWTHCQEQLIKTPIRIRIQMTNTGN